MDIYGENGTRLYRLGQSVGAMEQKMEAETNGKLYALAYGACVDTLSLWCHKLVPTRISWVESGVKVLCRKGISVWRRPKDGIVRFTIRKDMW